MGVFFVAGCRRSCLLGQFLLHSSPRWHLVQWLHAGAMLQSFVGLHEVWFHSAFEALWLACVWLACSRLALRPGGNSRRRYVPRREHRFRQLGPLFLLSSSRRHILRPLHTSALLQSFLGRLRKVW